MEEGFLAAIRAAPGDQSAKLAYVGWLGERGDPRAALLRSRETFRARSGDAAAAERFRQAVGEYLDSLKTGGHGARRWQTFNLLDELFARVDERVARTFETDCAERVLPIFEAAHSADDRPRAAVRACRLYLAGQADQEMLHTAVDGASAAMREADEPAWFAAAAACNAADYGNPYGGYPPSWHAVGAVAGCGGGEEAAEAERLWQIGRLLDLLLYGSDYPLPSTDLLDV